MDDPWQASSYEVDSWHPISRRADSWHPKSWQFSQYHGCYVPEHWPKPSLPAYFSKTLISTVPYRHPPNVIDGRTIICYRSLPQEIRDKIYLYILESEQDDAISIHTADSGQLFEPLSQVDPAAFEYALKVCGNTTFGLQVDHLYSTRAWEIPCCDGYHLRNVGSWDIPVCTGSRIDSGGLESNIKSLAIFLTKKDVADRALWMLPKLVASFPQLEQLDLRLVCYGEECNRCWDDIDYGYWDSENDLDPTDFMEELIQLCMWTKEMRRTSASSSQRASTHKLRKLIFSCVGAKMSPKPEQILYREDIFELVRLVRGSCETHAFSLLSRIFIHAERTLRQIIDEEEALCKAFAELSIDCVCMEKHNE